MAANTSTQTLKTAHIVLDTPAELATVLGHRQSQAVVVETSKPAAAEALGITMHKFNKWAAWEPVSHEVAAQVPGTVVWRDLNADDGDDAFSWWYLTDEGIPVEIPVGEHADDEDEGDELDGYDTLTNLDAPEGPQVIYASRHLTLADERADAADRKALCQYTEDGSRDFEDELAEVQADRDTLADIDREAGMEPVPATAPEPLDDGEDDGTPVISDADWAHLTGQTPAKPNTNEDEPPARPAWWQSQVLQEREEAAAELTAMDDRALAVKLMAGLNRQDPDDAREVIDMGGVQSQMWMAAAAIAREHFNA